MSECKDRIKELFKSELQGLMATLSDEALDDTAGIFKVSRRAKGEPDSDYRSRLFKAIVSDYAKRYVEMQKTLRTLSLGVADENLDIIAGKFFGFERRYNGLERESNDDYRQRVIKEMRSRTGSGR